MEKNQKQNRGERLVGISGAMLRTARGPGQSPRDKDGAGRGTRSPGTKATNSAQTGLTHRGIVISASQMRSRAAVRRFAPRGPLPRRFAPAAAFSGEPRAGLLCLGAMPPWFRARPTRPAAVPFCFRVCALWSPARAPPCAGGGLVCWFAAWRAIGALPMLSFFPDAHERPKRAPRCFPPVPRLVRRPVRPMEHQRSKTVSRRAPSYRKERKTQETTFPPVEAVRTQDSSASRAKARPRAALTTHLNHAKVRT